MPVIWGEGRFASKDGPRELGGLTRRASPAAKRWGCRILLGQFPNFISQTGGTLGLCPLAFDFFGLIIVWFTAG